MKPLTFNLVNLPKTRTIGMRWEGTWKEINSLRRVIRKMAQRVDELDGALSPKEHIGLSYHDKNNGFVHYSVFAVDENQTVPEGMIEWMIPESFYVHVTHPKNESIGNTYNALYEWILKSKYQLKLASDIKYYDPLPIKYEIYERGLPISRSKTEIYIPIVEMK